MKKDKFVVEGMTCSACVARVSKEVAKVNGVKDVSVNLLTHSMEVEYEGNIVSKINASVKKAGYKSYIKKENEEISVDNEVRVLQRRLIFSMIILIPLIYLSMGHMLGWNIFFFKDRLILLAVVEFLLALILIIINNKFFVSGFRAILHGSCNMDTLVALGSGVSFIYATILMIIMCFNIDNMEMLHSLAHNLTFETAGMVPSLITIGKYLEAISKGRTTNALKQLFEMKPKYANVIKDGKEEKIDIKDLAVGDIFIVRPGEQIPADGKVIDGNTSIDEQMLSGESMPKDKSVGSIVYQATLNQHGIIKCEATGVGSDTSFSKIIKLVEEASNSKAKISRLVDKVSSIFVPTIIAISVLVFITWLIIGANTSLDIKESKLTYALIRAISVLVISCPCALGLATPVAIMVGSGKAAKMGILYKNASVMEECGKANVVVLDKTGTITKGNAQVANFKTNMDEKEFLKIIASLENSSTHPIAKAIVEYANEKNIDYYQVSSFTNLVGFGVKGVINGKQIYALKPSSAKEIVDISTDYLEYIDNNTSIGSTVVVVIDGDILLGAISISDSIKEDSKEAINAFKALNIKPIMLTGDNINTAKFISSTLNVEYKGGLLPDEKANIIKDLRKNNKVIMIGDGINDAPSLKLADVGIAIGSGTDIAISSSDIVLMRSSLMDAVNALKFSRKILKNIKENLFWAFFYNLIMIPIASGILIFTNISWLIELRPWYGALAMSMSSLFVVLNALRLNLYKFKKN